MLTIQSLLCFPGICYGIVLLQTICFCKFFVAFSLTLSQKPRMSYDTADNNQAYLHAVFATENNYSKQHSGNENLSQNLIIPI